MNNTYPEQFAIHMIETLIKTGKLNKEKTWLKASPHNILITDVKEHNGRIKILLTSMHGKVWDYLKESDQIFNS